MIRDQVTEEHIQASIHKIFDEVDRRKREKGDGAYSGPHEAYGVIAEEFEHELLGALHANDGAQFRKELYDIIVACVWELASEKARWRKE